MLFGMFATACWRVVIERCRCRAAAERRIVADIRPQSAGHAFILGQHRHRRVVGMNALGGENVLFDLVNKRLQRGTACANPIGERRDIEIDAVVGVDLALPVQRQMRAILREQNMRQQLRPGPAACNRMRWCRCFGDLFARPAAELFADVADDLPADGDQLQRLRRGLAEFA